MRPDDEELVRAMAAGDRDAFAAFYDEYAPLAFGVIRRIVRDAGASEDVLQEVFWELWQAAGEYDSRRGSPAAWVITRARSRSIDRTRAVRRRSGMVLAGLNEMTAAVPETAVDAATVAEDRGVLRGALGQLPDAQREVIELAYFEGLTQSEIAERIRQPLGTIKTRMRLGLDKLRGLIGDRL